MSDKLNIGIVGAGNFAHFAARAFLTIPGVSIVAVHDSNEEVGLKMGVELKAKSFNNYKEFLSQPSIDLVYIATPPFLHYEQSKKALLAGKHVICEKPAAFKVIDALELQSLATSHKLLYVVNLMQRYNPLYADVKKIIDEKILGKFLHGFFENYASDENLKRDHWFWDETKSGGIFIEHGVHFFDMFSGWFGKGKILNAFQLQRPGIRKKLVDRVQATVLYAGGIVNFYHGFDQPTVLDRQELRLLFAKGEITLYEWIPVKMKLHGLFSEHDLTRLKEILGPVTISKNKNVRGVKNATGRFEAIVYDEHLTIEYADKSEKQERYIKLVKAMLQDQWDWIRDRRHVRLIDDTNAIESTRMAEKAAQTAQYFN